MRRTATTAAGIPIWTNSSGENHTDKGRVKCPLKETILNLNPPPFFPLEDTVLASFLL